MRTVQIQSSSLHVYSNSISSSINLELPQWHLPVRFTPHQFIFISQSVHVRNISHRILRTLLNQPNNIMRVIVIYDS